MTCLRPLLKARRASYFGLLSNPAGIPAHSLFPLIRVPQRRSPANFIKPEGNVCRHFLICLDLFSFNTDPAFIPSNDRLPASDILGPSASLWIGLRLSIVTINPPGRRAQFIGDDLFKALDFFLKPMHRCIDVGLFNSFRQLREDGGNILARQ